MEKHFITSQNNHTLEILVPFFSSPHFTTQVYQLQYMYQLQSNMLADLYLPSVTRLPLLTLPQQLSPFLASHFTAAQITRDLPRWSCSYFHRLPRNTLSSVWEGDIFENSFVCMRMCALLHASTESSILTVTIPTTIYWLQSLLNFPFPSVPVAKVTQPSAKAVNWLSSGNVLISCELFPSVLRVHT